MATHMVEQGSGAIVTAIRVSYTYGMKPGDLSFQLDIGNAESILTDLAMNQVEQSANAIADRANSMAASMSKDPPEFGVGTGVGVIRRGNRAIATVAAVGNNAHQEYIGHQALAKAKDAGRV